ncbi:DUF4307 domain-containing protein [Herbidospora sp. NEAU-GS84]|uniref:DUF4307 domain-containing protein n=1 Tax=Herbidospora solisilvae TaxID=2696284 RepID=A0A7C9J7S2_9ACTN|nr:DUF4307 domain-containing protein [Herbidospora solisilvae]NAS26705.1 DUF4307 domain-containing protein [Herbidospora solisilvae]
MSAPAPRPILGTPDEFPPRPPMGRGRFVVYAVMAVVVAVVAGGWGYVILSARGNPDVRADVITFDTSRPGSAEITFVVHKPDDRAATCRLRAVDVHHVEVGTREITIPPGRGDVALTEQVRINAQATSVDVQGCSLV